MSRVTLNTIGSLSNPSAINSLNENFALLAAALEKTVSRLAEAPDYMEADLDMNNKRLKNLPAPTTNTEPLRKGDIDVLELRTLRDTVLVKAQEATNSANAAAQALANAVIRALQALDSQVEAALSADAATAAKLEAQAAAQFASDSLALLQAYADSAAASASAAAASAGSVAADAARAENAANAAEADRAEVAANKLIVESAKTATVTAKDIAVSAAASAQATLEVVEENAAIASQGATNAGVSAANALASQNASSANKIAAESAAIRSEAAADQTELDAASALNSKNSALSSATTATNAANTSVANANQTGLDRTQTGLDRTSVASDRADVTNSKNLAQTAATNSAANATATSADRIAVSNDKDTVVSARNTTISARDLTLGYRDSASGSATTASSASVTAVNASNTAVAARDTAVGAADQASAYLGTAKIFQNTTDGIANTTGTGATNRYFAVPSSSVLNFIDLYLNDAGTAVLVKSYPAIQLLYDLMNNFGKSTVPGYQFVVQDFAGRIPVGVKDDGTFASVLNEVTDTLLVGTKTKFKSNHSPTYALNLIDTDGEISAGIRYSGVWDIKQLFLEKLNGRTMASIFDALDNIDSTPTVAPTVFDYYSEVQHWFSYGQSLSIGTGANVLSSSQPYDNVMFNGGVRTSNGPAGPSNPSEHTSLVPHVETQYLGFGETQCAGQTNQVKRMLETENNIVYTSEVRQFLSSAPGNGGQTVANLSKGTQFYTSLLYDIQRGYELAVAATKTYNVMAVSYSQGEDDQVNTPQASWIEAVRKMRLDIISDTKAKTGRDTTCPFIINQLATHKPYNLALPTIALAQLTLCTDDTYPGFYLACPSYIFTYNDDNVHMPAESYKWMGSYFGVVYKRVVVDGQQWRPVYPMKITQQGRAIILKFNVPYGKLVFDTTAVAANTNMGFEVFDGSGNAIAITSVTIVSNNEVKIVTNSIAPQNSEVRYACTGTGQSGPINGPRGNLRDTQGTVLIADPLGINKPLHNWCVMFRKVIGS